MAKKYLITISDDYVNDIKDYTDIHIDEEGIVWYLFSYEGGKTSEWIPVGTMEEESTEQRQEHGLSEPKPINDIGIPVYLD